MLKLGVIDLDGVLGDFINGSFLAHKRKPVPVTRWNYFEEWGITEAEFWKPINDAGADFYGSMVAAYPWVNDLMAIIRKYTADQVILTAPSLHPNCYAGKKIFVDKHLHGVKLVVSRDKQLLAGPDRVLIDDNDGNCETFTVPTEPWAYWGGKAVLFPQAWNVNAGLVDDRLRYVERRLRFLSR